MLSSSSLPFCFDLRFFMKLKANAIERINFVHFENGESADVDKTFIVRVSIIFRLILVIQKFFQWLSGSLRKTGGVNQNTMRSQSGIPQETWSAGLSFPQIRCHLETSVLLRISCTLFATKIFNLPLLLIQARTASLLLQKCFKIYGMV